MAANSTQSKDRGSLELQSALNDTNGHLDKKEEEEEEEKQGSIQNLGAVAKDLDLEYIQLGRHSKYSRGKPSPRVSPKASPQGTPTPISKLRDDIPIIIQLADSNDKIVKYFKYSSLKRLKLDYGFRSIYEMYDFNYRPLIYVILSIASVYLPSLFFPKGHIHKQLLFIIHFIFAMFNVLIIVWCLGKALAKMIGASPQRSNSSTEQNIANHKKQNDSLYLAQSFRPTDDEPEEYSISDIESFDGHDYEIHDVDEVPAAKPITVHNDSMISTHSQKSRRLIEISCDNVVARFFYTFCEMFNDQWIFNVNEVKFQSRIASKIAPPFSGFLLVFTVLCCHILLAVVTNKFEVGIFQLCQETPGVLQTASYDSVEDVIENGQCLIRKTAIINCNSLSVMILLIAFALLHEISPSAQERIKDRGNKIIAEFETRKKVIGKTEYRINRSLRRRIFNQLTITAMYKSLLLQTFFVAVLLFYHGIAFGYYSFTKTNTAILFSLFGKFNILVNGVILLHTSQRFVIQYRYILCVMRQFSKPIYCQNIDDVIAWWQYRKYYREYKIKVFANIFHPMVSWLLLLSLICVLYVALVKIIWRGYVFNPDDHVLMVIIAYLCFIAVLLCELAVRTHKEQSKRNCGILDREMIHCKRNLNWKIDLSLIVDIRTEIWNNSKPIVLVGLPMNTATIAAIRTYFASAVSALVLDWYLAETEN